MAFFRTILPVGYVALILLVAPAGAGAATFTPATQAQLSADITTAGSNNAADVIDLAGGTITLTTFDNPGDALPPVQADGGAQLTIRNGAITVAGGTDARILQLRPGSVVSLDNVVLSAGTATLIAVGAGADGARGGAMYSAAASLELDRVTILGSTARDLTPGRRAEGGGVYQAAGSTIAIRNSRFESNVAYGDDASGGALVLNGAFATVTDTRFRNNSALALDEAFGGAVDVRTAGAIISRSSFEGNEASGVPGPNLAAGGAVRITGPDGWVNLSRSTVTGNFADNEGSALSVDVAVTTASLLDHVTITGNAPSVDADVVGPAGGGPNTLQVRGSIVDEWCTNLVSLGRNYFKAPAPCAPSPAAGDITTGATGLGALETAGPTSWFPFGFASQLRDAGPATCPGSTDQRGGVSPSGPACDIGAIEYQHGDVDLRSGSGSFPIGYLGSGAPVTSTLAFENVSVAAVTGGTALGPITTTGAITGAAAGEFSVADVDCVATTLAPAATCKVNVTFSPTSAGTKSATLTLAFSGGDVVVPLSGTAAAPPASIVAAPSNVAFGARIIDSGAGAATSVTFTNAGPIPMAGPVAASDITLTGSGAAQFQVVSGSGACTGATLAPGASCSISTRFLATTLGDHAAMLTLAFAVHDVTVPLTGTGRPAQANCTDASVAAPVGSTTIVQLTCSGDVDSIELLDAPPSGILTLLGRTLTYTATPTDVGAFALRFRALNASGPSNTATLTVTRSRTKPLRGTATVGRSAIGARPTVVPCSIDVGAIDRCVVVARVGRVIVARGSASVRPTRSTMSTVVVLRPTPAGLVRIQRSLGGIDARLTVSFTARDGATARQGRLVRLLPVRQEVEPSMIRMFVGASATLSPAGRAHVRRVADRLRSLPLATITCTGHSAVFASTFGDLRIGAARAEVVCDELQRLGVRARFVLRTASGRDPRVSNATESGRELNRRVDLLVTYRAK